MHPRELRQRVQVTLQRIGSGLHRIEVIAGETHFHRVAYSLIVNLFETNIGIREMVLIFWTIFANEFQRVFLGSGVDDELGVVLVRHLRGVGGVEARRGTADERGDRGHPRVGAKHVLHAVGHGFGLRQRTSFGNVHLHGETVAVGLRQHLDLQSGEQESAERDGADGQQDDDGRVPEAVGQHFVVTLLQEHEETVLRCFKPVRRDTVLVALDENR